MIKKYLQSVLVLFVFALYFLPISHQVLALEGLDFFVKPTPDQTRKVKIKNKPVEIKPKYILPIDINKAYISTYFHDYHQGIDFASNGTDLEPDIHAIAKGKVVYARDTEYDLTDYGWGYGKTVVLKHEDDIYSLYAHLNSINVKEGEEIVQGRKIGEMGSTGNSTGTHLHFEMCTNKCQFIDSKKFDAAALFNIVNDEKNLFVDGMEFLHIKENNS